MVKFGDVLSRWERKQLSAMEAGEILGCSERQFRRYRARYEEEGLQGLFDRRLGKASARRVPIDKVTWMLGEYRTHYRGWNVKHFHEHLQKQHSFRWSYTWVKTQLHTAGLVERNKKRGIHRRKRPRKPCVGMMLHQDASRFAWLEEAPELDLIVTLDDATSEIYSAFLVEEEGTASSFRALLDVFTAHGLPSSLYTDRGSHYFFTPTAGGPVDKQQRTQVGRALAHLHIEHIPAYSPEARGRSERMFGTLQGRLPQELRLCGISDVAEANRYIREIYLPLHNERFAKPPQIKGSAFVPARDPQAFPTFCASSRAGWSRATTRCPTRDARCSSRKARCAPTTSRPTSRCASIRTARSRYSTVRDGWRATAPRERNSLTSRPSPA